MRNFSCSIGALITLMASTALAAPASAQSGPGPIELSEAHLNLDRNGFELAYGGFRYSKRFLSIGPNETDGLHFDLIWPGTDFSNNYVDFSNNLKTTFNQSFDLTRTPNSVTYDGKTVDIVDLSRTISNGIFIDSDGTKIDFSGGDISPTSIVYPNGLTKKYHYDGSGRLISIDTNLGYQIRITYFDFVAPNRIGSVQVINEAEVYCDPDAPICENAAGWPAISMNYESLTPNPTYNAADTLESITDATGQIWKYYLTIPYEHLLAVRYPGSSSDDISITYQAGSDFDIHGGNRAAMPLTIRKDGITTTYSRSFTNAPPVFTQVDAVDPLGNKTSYFGEHWRFYNEDNFYPSIPYNGRIDSIQDALNRTKAFTYDAALNVLSITYPEGNKEVYTYDNRSNRLSETIKAKPGAGLADIMRSAAYPSTCTNRLTCNKPSSYTDANGKTTDFTYDPAHGGILTETGPAVNGIRPQKRYSYSQRYAWVRFSYGGYIRAATPVWVLTSEKHCANSAWTGSACGIAGDEVVTAYDYGPDAGPNNLLLRGITVTAGGVIRRTCYSYDRLGHKISQTTPNANLTSCP